MTDQQTTRALKFIREHIQTAGYPPSRRQIAEAVDLLSSSDGQRVVEDLAAKGLIQVDPGVPRGIRVVAVADAEAL